MCSSGHSYSQCQQEVQYGIFSKPQKRWDGDLPLACQLKREILRRLKSKYVAEDLKVLMGVTSFLDPRYITAFLTTTDKPREDETEPKLNVVQERLLEQAVFLQHEEVADSIPEPPAKRMKLSLGALTSLKKPKERPSAAQSPRDRLSAEFEQYTKYPVIDCDEDPLKWWQRHELELPLLSQLAKRYLSIQASSSPLERFKFDYPLPFSNYIHLSQHSHKTQFFRLKSFDSIRWAVKIPRPYIRFLSDVLTKIKEIWNN